jgi:hypothetical protein
MHDDATLLALPLSKGELEGVLTAAIEQTPLNPPLERGEGIEDAS